MTNQADDLLKKLAVSQPSSRKSRSISRYFLGNKRSSIDDTTQNYDIYRCLISVGIFDSYDLWTNVTLFRDYTTCRRLFILTNKNELIIGKYHHRQFLFKIKYRIDLNRIWLLTNLNENHFINEITSLNYYDSQRSLIIGWPLAENFLVEFYTQTIKDIWKERFQSTLRSWWRLNSLNIEHVRIVIDQNYESDQNNHHNSTSFLIRKVIGIRPEETVRDLIKKCIDAFHLRDPLVDNYVLFVTNNQSNGINYTNSSSQTTQITNTPLIGHEYPYSIKMKHLKTTSNRSFDGDDHLSCQNQHNSSLTNLNNITTNNHDFELRKRDVLIDNQTKKYRFFHKRKTKIHQQNNDEYHSSSTPYLSSPTQIKYSMNFFGRTLDELILKYNQQLPPILMQLLEILYFKGPETTGIFRKVANTRSVKDCIEKIEHNISLNDDDLHPILAAGIFKHFLRSLPEPLFNSIQYDNWKKCLRLTTTTEKLSFARRNILSTLPEGNHLLLKGFICVLHHISEHADTNGMNPFNLGLCVSTSLFKTESTTITSGKQEADVMSSIVEFLIANGSFLFGTDIFTCITDKRIILPQLSNNLIRPTASSIESLDEVESSPHLPIVNRSHDSGLAASDQPLNDDSSEISEYFRRNPLCLSSSIPDWSTSIACGNGTVLTSIIHNTNSVTRRRSSKNIYKPSKQFLEREKLITNTTDDDDNHSSSTTINNVTIGKLKRSKSLSRHSSLGSNEHKHLRKESRRFTTTTINNVKRTSSLKQFHYSSDEEGDYDDEQIEKNKNLFIKNKTKTNIIKENTDDECMTTRSINSEQDLDLTNEPLSTINERLANSCVSTPTRLTSFKSLKNSNEIIQTLDETSPIICNNRLKSNDQHHDQTNINAQKSSLTTERRRTFVHLNSRPFTLGAPIQMRPINDSILSNDKRRPCQRQNALRYKLDDQKRSTPILINKNSRYQSIERRLTSSPKSIKSFSYDINTELQPSDISWSVREKAKLFEHPNQHKFSTGRENYV